MTAQCDEAFELVIDIDSAPRTTDKQHDQNQKNEFVPFTKEDLIALLNELEVDCFVHGSTACDLNMEFDPTGKDQELFESKIKPTPITIYSDNLEYLESLKQAILWVLEKKQIDLSTVHFKTSKIENKNWQESWKESFKPIEISNQMVILPPWENPEKFSQQHKIVIDPGMAFGTGQHETTRLCLENMLELIQQNGTKILQRVLDVGTGSGILAIGASKLAAAGALKNPFILGTDIDSSCIDIAKANSTNNNCDNILFTDDSIELIAHKEFTLALANIQSLVLKSIVTKIKERLASDGVMVLSGILHEEASEFIDFLKEQNIELLSIRVLKDWCALVCKK